ncbi:MAG: recombination protein O N-terminal domain-containing protein, partial [Bacteroidales bacterium]|nr:recombination protein O N-terminal domain-containing protein [Bacteroidales bacterium]
MVKDTELIVLHTTKFGENSLVVHTLSREYGRRSFLVKGAGKKSMMSLFLPLNMLEAD